MRTHLKSFAITLALWPVMAQAGQADLVWRNTASGQAVVWK